MKFRTFTAAAVLGLALTGTGYAACGVTKAEFTPPPSEGGNSVAQQYAPPPSEGGNSVAQQYTPPPSEGGNSVAQQYTPPPSEGGNSVACN
jgi:hypothetical protein